MASSISLSATTWSITGKKPASANDPASRHTFRVRSISWARASSDGSPIGPTHPLRTIRYQHPDPCGTHRSRLDGVLKPDNKVKVPSRRTPARGEVAEVDTSDQNAQTAPKGISMRSSHEVTPANKAETVSYTHLRAH